MVADTRRAGESAHKLGGARCPAASLPESGPISRQTTPTSERLMAMRLTCLVLALAGAAHGFHAVPVAASAHRLHSRPAAASHAVRSAGAPAMGLMDSLKNFFRGEEAPAKCAALLARAPPHALRSATARVRACARTERSALRTSALPLSARLASPPPCPSPPPPPPPPPPRLCTAIARTFLPPHLHPHQQRPLHPPAPPPEPRVRVLYPHESRPPRLPRSAAAPLAR